MPDPHDARRLGATRVTLLTEGTYPHSHGGVSVWCDQLFQGMPDLDFDVIAVTGTGREPLVWDLPAHVRRVLSVPMWGDPPEGRAPRGRARHRLTTAYERFLTALLDPGAEDGFAPALYELARAAADGTLTPFLRSDRAIAQLAAVWNRPGLAVREARPTLHDARSPRRRPRPASRTRSAAVSPSSRASPPSNGTASPCCSPNTASICASATSATAPPPTAGPSRRSSSASSACSPRRPTAGPP